MFRRVVLAVVAGWDLCNQSQYHAVKKIPDANTNRAATPNQKRLDLNKFFTY